MPSPHETLKPCSDTRISEVLESQKPACDKPSASSASSATNRATSAETIMPMPCAKTAARRRHKYIRLSPANTDSLEEEQQTPKPSEFNCFGLLGSPHRCVFCMGLALCRLSSTSMVLGHTHTHTATIGHSAQLLLSDTPAQSGTYIGAHFSFSRCCTDNAR